MLNSNTPDVAVRKINPDSISEVKKLLQIEDPKTPLIALTFDEDGKITVISSDIEFNGSPFDLANQKFANITPATFITTHGSCCHTVIIGGYKVTVCC